ncbi:hypothetical protein [Saccharopolyspora spinosa]|uniref:Excreted virulence factor EspC (Type VII ESX diderm) n=1 Tax=Saccharopolyspora spinosa TaxID=60894 RepID=A0A2N3Y757_SACSN|nr:hypothetical protein [Saccharopolyspora spinosa]PKW18772.1 hypothetical protein A8926_6900 [Saccharopolyspora spinosa]
MPENRFTSTDKVLTEVAGITCAELDDTHPVDIVLKVIAENVAHHQDAAKRFADGNRHVFSLASCSDSGNYDAAVASMQALREPLSAAVDAYRQAHRTGPQETNTAT